MHHISVAMFRFLARLQSRPGPSVGRPARRHRCLAAPLWPSVLVLGSLLCLPGCSNPLAAQPTGNRHAGAGESGRSLQPLLHPSAGTIDLGIVPQGGHETETFSLNNAGSTPVEVARVETSCDCLDIHLLRRVIGPSEKVLVQATLDLSKEPDFRGSLAIEVKGLTSSGGVAFAVVVNVTVRPRAEFGLSGLGGDNCGAAVPAARDVVLWERAWTPAPQGWRAART